MRTFAILSCAAALSGALAILPAYAAPGDEPAPRGGRAAFSTADANKDGFVDRAEWQAQRDRIFDRLDADHDGVLVRDEVMRGRGPAAARPATPRTGTDGQFGDGNQPRRDRFARMDTNNDGKVTRAEFAATSDQLFARCDRNGDGRVTRGECQGGRQRAAAAQRTPRD